MPNLGMAVGRPSEQAQHVQLGWGSSRMLYDASIVCGPCESFVGFEGLFG